MKRTSASIDLGSHTARLFVAQYDKESATLRPLARKRAYTRLAEDFSLTGNRFIQPDALARTKKVLVEFLEYLKKFDCDSVYAVATGVFRDAPNGREALEYLMNATGLEARIVTGAQEAMLTSMGALNSLGMEKEGFVLFDLGGVSTEFVWGDPDDPDTSSVPIGCLSLTREYIKSDPPALAEMDSCSLFIDNALEGIFHDRASGYFRAISLIGTGGTVTTLGAMKKHVNTTDLGPEMLNGTVIEKGFIESVFEKAAAVKTEQRSSFRGLDRERAGIIVAGMMAVLRIMGFFRAERLVVSMSDILEGVLLEQFRNGESAHPDF